MLLSREVKYWDGEDFTVLDSKNAKSVNGIKFRINEDILEYSNDGLTWSTKFESAKTVMSLDDTTNDGIYVIGGQ